MTGTRFVLSVTLLAAAAAAHAAPPLGGLFNRKSRADAPKVRQLLDTARANPDEKRRLAAVLELREYDPRLHTDIVGGLRTVLQKDPAAGVRAAAAEILGQVRPVAPANAAVLETALDSDPSEEVRRAVRDALWEYHVAGYRSPKGVDRLNASQTAEPPFARRPAVVRTTPAPEATVEVASVSLAVKPDRRPAAAWPPLVPLVLPPKPDPGHWLPTIPLPVDTEPPIAATLPVGTALPPPTPLTETVTVVSAVPPPILDLTSEPNLARPVLAVAPTLSAVRRPGPLTSPFDGRVPGSRLMARVKYREPLAMAPAPRLVPERIPLPTPPVGFTPVAGLPPVTLPPTATPSVLGPAFE